MTSAIRRSDTQQIWQEFGDRLRAFIARRVDSEADADDILQDVFLRVHQHAGGVHQSDRLTSWLFQVTRNAIADYYRAPARREQPESVTAQGTGERSVTATPVVELDFDEPQARAELASCLRPMMERLPLHYREAVELVDLIGLTQVQAAARLGLSVSGMKSRVQRGRQALKDTLVACCPVQLDPGGRIIDYEESTAGCTSCAGRGGAATPVEERGHHQGRCCAPRPPERAGGWDLGLAALQGEAAAQGQLDGTRPVVDGTTVRAHQHAAGANKGAAIRRSAAPGAA